MHPLEFEVITKQIPNKNGKLLIPQPDHDIIIQAPISMDAFIWAIRRCKSVEVRAA